MTLSLSHTPSVGGSLSLTHTLQVAGPDTATEGALGPREREIFIDNLLVRVHLLIEMSRPALRYGSLNSLFQVALHLPSKGPRLDPEAGPRLNAEVAKVRPGGNPGANRWFLWSNPIQMLPERGCICGRLTQDLPSNRLQGGVETATIVAVGPRLDPEAGPSIVPQVGPSQTRNPKS